MSCRNLSPKRNARNAEKRRETFDQEILGILGFFRFDLQRAIPSKQTSELLNRRKLYVLCFRPVCFFFGTIHGDYSRGTYVDDEMIPVTKRGQSNLNVKGKQRMVNTIPILEARIFSEVAGWRTYVCC